MPIRRESFIDTRVIAIFFSHILIIFFLVLDTGVGSHPSKAMVQALPMVDTVLGCRLLTSCDWRGSSLLFRSIGPARPHRRSDELASSLDTVCLGSSATCGHALCVSLMLAVSFMADRAVLHHWCRQSRPVYDNSGITNYHGRRSDGRSAFGIFHCLIVYLHLCISVRCLTIFSAFLCFLC